MIQKALEKVSEPDLPKTCLRAMKTDLWGAFLVRRLVWETPGAPPRLRMFLGSSQEAGFRAWCLHLDFLGFSWIFLDFFGFSSIFLDFLGISWILLDFLGFSWIFLIYWISWIFLDFLGFS